MFFSAELNKYASPRDRAMIQIKMALAETRSRLQFYRQPGLHFAWPFLQRRRKKRG
jgi:hypothetical protein